MKQRYLGLTIVGISVIAVGMLLWFHAQLNAQNLQACENLCGAQAGDSCGIESCPYLNNSANSDIIIFTVLLIAFLGGIGFYLSLAKSEKIIEQKEYDLTGLDETEKRIFRFVKESGSGVYQSDIVRKLDISKVKVTRMLDRLEQKGIIERKRRGMTNVVHLK